MPADLSHVALADAARRAVEERPLRAEADDAPERSHAPIHAALGLLGAATAADIITTRGAMARGGREANSRVYGEHPSWGKLVGLSLATTAPSAFLFDRLYNEHPKIAMGLALGLAGGVGAVAAHNTKVGR